MMKSVSEFSSFQFIECEYQVFEEKKRRDRELQLPDQLAQDSQRFPIIFECFEMAILKNQDREFSFRKTKKPILILNEFLGIISQ